MKTAFWFYPGIFLYHLLYLKASFGNENSTESLSGPSVLSKGSLRKTLPGADQLHGQYGALMHEAQMNDSRMNINTLLTSSIDSYHPGMKGVSLCNYTEFLNFNKNESGKITGATIKDTISGKEINVKSKVVVNCTGIHADSLR